VGVTHGGIGNQKLFLFQYPFDQTFSPFIPQPVTGPVGARRGGVDLRYPRFHQVGRPERPADARRTIDDNVSYEIEYFCGAIPFFLHFHQFGMFVDKGRITFSIEKSRVGNYVFKKGYVGLDPADTEFPKGTVHDLRRFF
jgi:hypothetical protein